MPLIPGSQYECFPCLERPGFIAVRPTDGSNKGGIVARVTAIEMTDCSFFVSEAGRQQAIDVGSYMLARQPAPGNSRAALT